MYYKIVAFFVLGLILGPVASKYVYPWSLNEISSYSDLVVAISSLIALPGVLYGIRTYIDQKRKENIDRIFDQINMFRSVVLVKANKSIGALRQHQIRPVKLKDFTLESLKTESKETRNIFDIFSKKLIQEPDAHDFKVQLDDCLNAVEEFSMKIKMSGLEDDAALHIIIEPFIEIIIVHSVQLYLNINLNSYPFSNTVYLYKRWLPIYEAAKKEKPHISEIYNELSDVLKE